MGATLAPFDVSLTKGQSYIILNGVDGDANLGNVAGSKLTSDKDIVVISGSHHQKTTDLWAQEAGVDMIPPVDNLGSDYYLVRSEMNADQEYGLAVITENATEVFVGGVSQGSFDAGDPPL